LYPARSYANARLEIPFLARKIRKLCPGYELNQGVIKIPPQAVFSFLGPVCGRQYLAETTMIGGKLPLYAHDLPAEKRASVYEIDLSSPSGHLQSGLEPTNP
jgi:hypothetical protein